MKKVFISDNLSEKGVEILRATPGIEVHVDTGLSKDELREAICRSK